jgi:hypothetical protein
VLFTLYCSFHSASRSFFAHMRLRGALPMEVVQHLDDLTMEDADHRAPNHRMGGG